jgi:rhodanese-related sulfurtransferase
MKKVISLLLVMAFVPMLLTTGCKKEKVKTDFEILTEYAGLNNLDLSNILDGWVIPASKLNVDPNDFSVTGYYIMDFRKAGDFDKGHIKDAHNVSMGNLLTEAKNAGGTPILCVCYTGQKAARATGLLRMSGYTAKSMKWGMAGWHADFAGKWDANATDYDSPNWITSGDPASVSEFSTPDFSTGKSEAADMLADRINKAIANSTWTISKTDVLGNPENYFVNNFWPPESWNEYGHVKGAYRISDLKLESLKNLNPDETIVTYCYTGQTSSIVTSWLNVMGYDKAKSLLFGANGIVHSKLLNGSSGKAPAKSWKGTGSSSTNNLGYYDKDGNLHGPE